MVIEGLISLTGGLALAPGVGWMLIPFLLAGTVLVLAASYLQGKATEQIHNPIELWGARSAFGTREPDGEYHGDGYDEEEERLKSFLNVSEEATAWYRVFYSPVKLDREATENLGVEFFDDEWAGELAYPAVRWGSTMPYPMPKRTRLIKLFILLPGFLVGQSSWRASLHTINKTQGASQALGISPECTLTPAGLVVKFEANVERHIGLKLIVDYMPKQGIDEEVTVHAKIFKGA